MERVVASVGVVVVDVVSDEAFELAGVPDDGAVAELSAHGADPGFRERVGGRGANGGLEDLEGLSRPGRS